MKPAKKSPPWWHPRELKLLVWIWFWPWLYYLKKED
jgi:hypothetical protein